MGKVLKADASAADAWVEIDLGSDQAEVWLTFDIRFSAATLAAWISEGLTLAQVWDPPHTSVEDIVFADNDTVHGIWTGGWGTGSPPFMTADVWQTVELHHANADTVDLYVDGTLIYTSTDTLGLDTRFLTLGLIGRTPDPDNVAFFDNVKAGTTRGASDLFSDDFEGGDLSAWSSTSGDVAVVDDPFAPVVLEGRVLIAFDDGPLAENPDWTRIDDTPDLVSGYDIHAGRQSEQDQTDASTAVVYLNDTQGLFDPANVSSPYYGKLDGKQILLQLQNPVTAEWVSQYRGFIDDYGYDLHESQVVTNIQISCTDWLDFLGGVEMIPGLFGDSPPAGSEGVVFYEDTDFQTRLQQLASTDAGVPASRTRFFTGNVYVQETRYDPGDSILMGLRDCVDAEWPGVANLGVDKRGILFAHGRFARFDPDGVSFGTDWDFRRWKAGDGAAIALDPDRAQIRPPLNWTRPRSQIINAAIAWPRYPLAPTVAITPLGQGTFAEADIPGQISLDPTSVTDFWYHAKPPMGDLITLAGFTTGNDAKTETKLYADYYTANFSQPRTRVESLTFKSLPPDDPRAPATWGLICGADISDVINLAVGYPGGVGLAAEDWYVEGYDLQVRPLRDYDLVEARYNISPTAYYDVDPFA